MSLEKLGLGAIVKFDGSQAVAGMRTLGTAAGRMGEAITAGGAMAGRALQGLGGGISKLGLAFTPIAAGMAMGANVANDFEEQMSAVKAVASATPEEFEAMRRKAKEMGSATKFTATESAKAMEELARAGFSAQETITGLSGVMAAAAADSIPLDTAAGIIASTLRSMGLEAEKSGNVADVLAKASAISNSAMIDIGEAMKFAAPVAKTMGVNLVDTTTAIAAMADVGIKGTLAGTALKNAMLKLADPSTAGAAAMAELGGQMKLTKDGSLDLFGTFASLQGGLAKIGDKTKQATLLNEIFSVRGVPAFTAWQNAVERTEGSSNKLVNMQKELTAQMKTGGAAAEMAAIRQDNFNGALEKAKSAVEGFQIEFWENFQKGGKDSLLMVGNFISGVVDTMRLLNEGVDKSDEKFSKLGETAVAIGTGIKEGVTFIEDAISMAKARFEDLFGTIGEDTTIMTSVAKWVTVVAMVGAALAPVLIAVGGLVYLIGGALTAAFGAVSGTGLAIFGALVFAVNAVRAEGETLMEAFFRIFNGIQGFVLGVIDSAIMPLITAIQDNLGGSVGMLSESFKIFFGTLVHNVKKLAPLFEAVFGVIGTIVGLTFQGIAAVFSGVFIIVGEIVNFAVEALRFIMSAFVKMVEGVSSVIEFFGGPDIVASDSTFAALAEFASQKEGAGFLTDAGSGALAAASIKEAESFGKGAPAAETPGEDQGAYKFEDVVASIADASMAKGAGAASTPVQVDLAVEDQRTLDVHSCVNVDGRQLAVASSRNQVEVNERRGFKDSPWQRRVILEQGATAVVSPG